MRRVIVLLACAIAVPAAAQVPALELFVRRDKGHCIACHQVPEGAGPQTRADLGPRLEGTRMRELGRRSLRAFIVDPTAANPDTVMPPFGRHRLLEPGEIDRIVDYLHALP
jgi:sulfur-oxidizing protein SoxX